MLFMVILVCIQTNYYFYKQLAWAALWHACLEMTKCKYSTANYVTNAPFRIHSDSFLNNHHAIQNYTILQIKILVTQSKNKYSTLEQRLIECRQ